MITNICAPTLSSKMHEEKLEIMTEKQTIQIIFE